MAQPRIETHVGISFQSGEDLARVSNGVENAIRPECLGKKNWLFAYTPSGANASAFFYSLIETAKVK